MIMTFSLTKIIRYTLNVSLIVSSCNFSTENESVISWVTNAPSPLSPYLENFAGAYRNVQPAEAPLEPDRADTRPSRGSWKPIPPHRAFLPLRCGECLPWCCVLLPVGSDPSGSRLSVRAVTGFQLLALAQVAVPGSARLMEGCFCRSFVAREGGRGL